MAIMNKSKNFKMTPSLIALLGFGAIILFGAFLLCLPWSNVYGVWMPFVDALFTATTSVCVTGLMVFDIAMELSVFGQVVVLLLIQVGGLGFVVMATFLFLLIGKKINYSTRMTIQEALSKEDNDGVLKTVKRILLITFVCEFAGFLMLAPSMISFVGDVWKGLFMALFLAVSAFCNAGIDPCGVLTPEFSNLAVFANNAFVLIPVMMLIFLGGIGFIVILDVIAKPKKIKSVNMHTRLVLRVTGLLVLVGALFIAVFEWSNPKTLGGMSFFNKILNAFFQSISARTAGFATFDLSQMTPISVAVYEILMVIGGSPVSLAGGIKTTTFFVLMLFLFKNTDRNGDIIYKNRKISHQTINKSVKISLLTACFIFVGSIIIYAFEGESLSFASVLFEVISAVCTVGSSFGITATLTAMSKLVLIALMFVGRVGMLTIPLAFKAVDTSVGIEYTDSKIIVG